MDPEVDRSELAMKMLEWERAQKEADLLRAEIEWAVMEIGKTVDTGNVRASYSAGRKIYDYVFAAGSHPEISEDIVQSFTVTVLPRTDWRKICEHIGIDKADIPHSQAPPSVTVKLLS